MPTVDSLDSQSTLDGIVESLTIPGDQLPVQAVARARELWDAFLPRLLSEMRSAIEMVRRDDDPGEIAFWGIALIAERKPGDARAALPLLVDIASLPTEQIEMLIGDLVTEMLPQALANVAGDQIGLLDGMFGDAALDIYARWSIGNALIRLVAEGVLPADDAVQLFQRHLQRVLQQHREGTFRDDEFFPTIVVDLLEKLLPHDALEDMLAAFAAGLVEDFTVDEECVRERMHNGQAAFDDQMQQVRKLRMDDCLDMLAKWGSFGESSPARSSGDHLNEITPGVAADTIERHASKVGRNDPCPCGSGRKYKKCCGRS